MDITLSVGAELRSIRNYSDNENLAAIMLFLLMWSGHCEEASGWESLDDNFREELAPIAYLFTK